MIFYTWGKYLTDPPVVSTETWNGGSGVISFNYLQQRPEEAVQEDADPIVTDPWEITDGGFRG